MLRQIALNERLDGAGVVDLFDLTTVEEARERIRHFECGAGIQFPFNEMLVRDGINPWRRSPLQR